MNIYASKRNCKSKRSKFNPKEYKSSKIKRATNFHHTKIRPLMN